jgi:hypothetical protein
MFKLEHNEAMVLLQLIEVSQFLGKDIPMIGKIIEKLQREAIKTQPPGEEWSEGQVISGGSG